MALERSSARPATYGPRSMTATTTVRPAGEVIATRVPQGSVRWATPSISGVYVCPQAVRLP